MDPEPSQDLPEAQILTEGQVLAGKYKVLRLLGRGGMAEVYAAHHEILHQTVALKVLLPAVAAIPGAATRFLNEARSAARIRSEHVAAVMDVGMREDGSAYIVLEYLEGEELQKVVDRRGPLPPSEAVDYVLQALEALAHAHAIGIVHRDLKPSNIFLSRGAGGTTIVKVFDFGISKAPKNAEPADQSSTASQIILGTPSYMSPEQARSAKEVDARSDIWSLGVILYRLLTGNLPFMADSIADMLAAILVQPHRPLRSFRPELSRDIESVVSRCLSKDRESRFASVAELAQALSPHASFAGRASVDRISRTLGVSSAAATVMDPNGPKILPPANPVPASAPVSAATKIEGRTDAGWMEASVAKPRGPATPVRWLVGGIGAVLALSAGVFLWRAPHGATTTIGPASSDRPVAAIPAAIPAAAPPSAAPAATRPAPVVDAGSPATAPVVSTVVAAALPAPVRTAPAPSPHAGRSSPHASPSGSAPPTAAAAPSARAYDVLDQRN